MTFKPLPEDVLGRFGRRYDNSRHMEFRRPKYSLSKTGFTKWCLNLFYNVKTA